MTVDFEREKGKFLLSERHPFYLQHFKALSQIAIKPETLDSQFHEEMKGHKFTPVQEVTAFVFQDESGEWIIKHSPEDRVGHVYAGLKKIDLYSREWAGSSAHAYNHIFRPFMGEWMRERMEKYRLPIQVVEEWLMEINGDYWVVSKKVKAIGSASQMVHKWNHSAQEKWADLICKMIYKTGYMDAHLGNFEFGNERVNVDGVSLPKTMILDTEPFGFLTERNHPPDAESRGIFRGKRRLSLREARLAGLLRFKDSAAMLCSGAKEKIDGWIQKARSKMAPTKCEVFSRIIGLVTCNIFYCIGLCFCSCKGKKEEEEIPLL